MSHRVIIFSPFRNNVLDFVGAENLVTPDGRKVRITHGWQFAITFDGVEVCRTDDNVSASAFLNNHEVGVAERGEE